MTDLSREKVRAELDDIKRRLAELPDNAFVERVKMRERWLELQALAGELRKTGRSPAQLKQELQELRDLRNEVFDRHLSVGNIGGGGGPGGGGIEIRYLNEVNRTIDEAGNLGDIDRRIQELETALADPDS